MIGVVLALGVGYLLISKPAPKRAAIVRASKNKSFGAEQAAIGKMFAPVDQRQENPLEAKAARGEIILPSGGGFLSETLSAGAATALGAAKTYADAKTGGAVSKAEAQIKSGDTAGAAYSYNAGVTVAQPKK